MFECTIAEATFVAAQAIPPCSIPGRDRDGDVDHSMSESESRIVIRNRQLSAEDVSVPVSVLCRPQLTPESLAEYLQAAFPGSRWQLYVVGVLFWLQKQFPQQMFAGGRKRSRTSDLEPGRSMLVQCDLCVSLSNTVCLYVRHLFTYATYLALTDHSLLLSLPLSLCLCLCLCSRPAASLLSLLSVCAASLLPVCCLLSLCYVSAVSPVSLSCLSAVYCFSGTSLLSPVSLLPLCCLP